MSTPRNLACTSNFPASSPGAMSKITFLKLSRTGFQTGTHCLLPGSYPTLPPRAAQPRQCCVPPRARLPLCHSLSLFSSFQFYFCSAHLSPFLRLALKHYFLFQDAFPASCALGCLALCHTKPTAFTLSHSLSCLPHHPDSSFRAGTMLLLLSHPVPSPEIPPPPPRLGPDILPSKDTY